MTKAYLAIVGKSATQLPYIHLVRRLLLFWKPWNVAYALSWGLDTQLQAAPIPTKVVASARRSRTSGSSVPGLPRGHQGCRVPQHMKHLFLGFDPTGRRRVLGIPCSSATATSWHTDRLLEDSINVQCIQRRILVDRRPTVYTVWD